MSSIPQFYCASTQEVVDISLNAGVIKYPGIIFVEEQKYLLWITKENKAIPVGAYKQIADVDYNDQGDISFYSDDDDELFSIKLNLTKIISNELKKITLKELDSDIQSIINDKIGNLCDCSTVSDFVNGITYQSLNHTPISNIYTADNQTAIIRDLDDGIYKVYGQFKIYEEQQFSSTSTEDTLFLVYHDYNDDTNITMFSSDSIVSYHLTSNGEYSINRYITEEFLNGQNYLSFGSVNSVIDDILEKKSLEVKDYIDEKFSVVMDKIKELNDGYQDLANSVDQLDGIK